MIAYPSSGAPIKAWVEGVPIDPKAVTQIQNTAKVPVVKGVAVMPDAHFGIGATVGSVVATEGAIIPAAVGVDIGCGMMAIKTTLDAQRLPTSLKFLYESLVRHIPHGTESYLGRYNRGSWTSVPEGIIYKYSLLAKMLARICEKYPQVQGKTSPLFQLGTLGGGNHFIEVCVADDNKVWVVLHSGSRGIGNLIGQTFINLAREDMKEHIANLPDKDLAYFAEGNPHFDDYTQAMFWAQHYARTNREAMMMLVLRIMQNCLPSFEIDTTVINCHHNYATQETYNGKRIWITRKGAIGAYRGQLGIIPGSMGAETFIVRGKGNEDAFNSASHGAGRVMSRGQAKKLITLEQHVAATQGIECRKDDSVLDESPNAYKDINDVMKAQADLVEIVSVLSQVICVKG